MDIREYLFKNKLTAAEMARQLGVHPHYLRLISRGDVRAGKRLAEEIEIYTGGQVKADDLRARLR